MIQLYKANNTNFKTNGDMILKPSKCTLKMELETGLNEIELVHPLDNEGRWKAIDYDDVISVNTPYIYNADQLYRVYEKVKNMSSITIKARHIFYDLIDTMLIDVRPTNQNGQQALNYILSGTKFIAHSDISKINTAYYVRKNIIEAIGGDKENSFLSRWGGELFLNNYNVYINNRIGLDNKIRIAYGKNLEAIEENINLESVVTRIVPTGYDGIMLSGAAPWVDSPLINSYANIKMREVHYDDIKVKTDNDDEGFATIELARQELVKRAKEEFTKGIDKPPVNYQVNFIDLCKTEEYKDYKILEEVLLGDTVHIEHKRLGIDIEARVIAFEYNCLTDRHESIELGNYISNLAKDNANNSNSIDRVTGSFDNNGNLLGSNIQGYINAFKAPILAQKDAAQKLDIVAMLMEDKDPISPNYGAMALGTKGFMIANTRTPDGRDWNWRTFGTGRGFIADEIITGVLKSVLIENLDGSFHIDLSKKGGALFKNNGTDAIEIANNKIKLYNWSKNGDYIGSLGALVNSNNPNKPNVGLWNDIDSYLTIGYAKPNDINVYSYMSLDKYNVHGDSIYPIKFWEKANFLQDIIITRSILNIDNAKIFDSISNLLCFEAVNGFHFGLSNGTYIASYDKSSHKVWIDSNMTVDKKLHVNGDFAVVGSKNCIQSTVNYGDRLFYATEDTESLLTDTGKAETTLQADGTYKKVILIDNIFKECVDLRDYYIFLTKYGKGDIWIEEQTKDYFIVASDNPIKFNWKIEATRKGYEGVRLKEYWKGADVNNEVNKKHSS